MSKVLMWTPPYDLRIYVHMGFQWLRDSFALMRAGHVLSYGFSASSDIARQRNMALELALKSDAEYMLMQDADVYVPEGVVVLPLLEHLQTAGAAMAGVPVGLRRMTDTGEVIPNVRPAQKDQPIFGAVYEADRIGTGLILVDLAQIAEIAQDYQGPWFARTYDDARQSVPDYGEDIFFCEVLRAHGKSIIVDGTIRAVHVRQDHDTLDSARAIFQARGNGVLTPAR